MLIFAGPAMSQEGSNLRFKVNGISEGDAKLAYYFADKQYIKDTVAIAKDGSFAFKSDEKLDQGIYLVVLPPDNQYFEVIVDDKQDWTMETEYLKLTQKMKIKGSKENSSFYEYLKFVDLKKGDVQKVSETITKFETDSLNPNYKGNPEYLKAKAERDRINKEVIDYKETFIVDHPDAFISKVFKASKEPEVPDFKLPSGEEDKQQRWYYFKEHYWDNIDIADDRMLRTPVLHGKLDYYMTKLVVQVPDSINEAADKLLSKVPDNSDVLKYFIIYITNTFETSKQMGMDAVFVHMAKNYYMSGKAYWAHDTLVQKIGDRALKLDPILIGKVAPNLVMKDTSGVAHELHKLKNNITILYFWDPDCGHCKKETPKLKALYEKEVAKEMDIEVFSVNTTQELELWKKFIIDHDLNWINVHDPYQITRFKDKYDIYSTPVVYVLDKDKKIIAKRLGIDQLEEYLMQIKDRELKKKPQDK